MASVRVGVRRARFVVLAGVVGVVASLVSPTDAQAFYKSTLMGDPVEITGTTIKLSSSDGDLFDWTYSWDQWENLSVKTADAS